MKKSKLLAAILAVLMVFSAIPTAAFASSESTKAGTTQTETQNEFLRIFHLDCGRKYFSVSEIEGMIDQLAANHYTHIQLAFGNNGFRFLLDDMSVTVNGTPYSSDSVKSAITSGNSSYSSSNDTASTMLSQTDMDAILAYAAGKNISVIPMVNTPGHMDALVSAMKTLGIRSSTGSEMSLTSDAEKAFILALQKKYMEYFAAKGSKYYNFAADEYSFSSLSDSDYTQFAEYFNALAAQVKAAGMTPLAYNDGIYYSGKTTATAFDTDVLVCYWSNGDGYASAADLANKGFKIINNTNNWYYVLGDYLYRKWVSGQWGYSDAVRGLQTYKVTQVKGDETTGAVQPVGSVLCVWCDCPLVNYTDTGIKATSQTNQESVYKLIQTMAEQNPDYFKDDSVEIAAKDATTNVSVTVRGQNGANVTVNVTKLVRSSYAPEGAVSYEIKPIVNGAAYTAAGKVALPVPSGWEPAKVRAYIVTNGEPSLLEGTYDADAQAYAFNVPHFSEIGLMQLGDDDALLDQYKTITIKAGSSKTIQVSGEFEGPYSTTDSTVATVSTTVTPSSTERLEAVSAIESGKQYLLVSKRSGYALTESTATNTQWGSGHRYLSLSGANDISNTTDRWTITASGNGYTIQSVSGKYLWVENESASVTATRTVSKLGYDETNECWDIADSGEMYHLNQWGGGSYTLAAGYTTGSETDPGSRWILQKVVGGEAQTAITFEGKKLGTTTVTIGTVKYTIQVVDEDTSEANPLPIQLWQTNNALSVEGITTKSDGQFNAANNGVYAYFIQIDPQTAYGPDGVSLKSLVPDAIKNTSSGNVVAESGDPDADQVYWKGTVLNRSGSTAPYGLQLGWSNDMTQSGQDFQYVRYYKGKWEVSADLIHWTEVTGEGSTDSYTTCQQQVIAYYLQRTKVTAEVITDVVDWGNTTEKWEDNKPTQYGVLDFAVQYPDDVRIPGTFPETGKTMYFHCDESDAKGAVLKDANGNYYRWIGMIQATDTTDYSVYMITVTPTSDDVSDQLTDANTSLDTVTSISYNGTEKVVWVDDEINLPEKFQSDDAKYRSISGNFAYHSGGMPKVDGLEIYQRQGMLVTYYVRALDNTDSLQVRYVDEVYDDYEFYTYLIDVKPGTEFSPEIALDEPWKGVLKNGTVENDLGNMESVSADLSSMIEIPSRYRHAVDYACSHIQLSDDHKTLTLYYNFTHTKTFVADFGLPLVIQPKDFSATLADATITIESEKFPTHTDYANLSADGLNVVYTLNRTLSEQDTFGVTFREAVQKANDEVQQNAVTYGVSIIPATSVYYEDSFASFTDKNGDTQTGFEAAGDHDELGKWYLDGETAADASQALSALGSKDVYGYDAAYATSQKFSLGSAKKVTVDATTNAKAPTAQFTFTGTGFDIISVTNSQSGAIYAYIYSGTDTSGTPVKSYVVNDYYGYRYDKTTKQWTVDAANSDTLYQIPVMKVKGLTYGQYTVVIKVGYSAYQDVANAGHYSFWMDAIRVYDPMGTDNNETYAKDGEGYPQYIKLRDQLADSKAEGDVVFIDGADAASIEDYKNYGPNNEVYLAKGQAITFQLAGDIAKVVSVQLGAKAPNGAANLNVNGTDVVTNLSTATEMYYDITAQAVQNGTAQQITITNNGEGILSLTNLKVTYTAEGTVQMSALNETQQTYAVMAVRALFAPVVQTFEPERLEASWNRSSVREGQRATLTVKASTDVEAITVNGETVSNYRTRTERTGWGWNAKRVTYREFTYTVTASATTDYTVAALNAEGTASAPITATLTVTQSANHRQWWNIFSWF